MFSCVAESFDLNTCAMNLPRPHDRVYSHGRVVDKIKSPALRITANGFFAESVRIASNRDRKPSGRQGHTLQEYLQYLEYLAEQRCIYMDDAVPHFDEEFRSSASEEGFVIGNQHQLTRISLKYLHADLAKGRTNHQPYPIRPPNACGGSVKSESPSFVGSIINRDGRRLITEYTDVIKNHKRL